MLQPIKLFSSLAPQKVQAQQNNNAQFHVNFATKPDTFEKSTPKKSILAPAYVPFTGWAGDQPVRDLGHIVCPCCGQEMMTQKDMNDVEKHLGTTSKTAFKTLDKYEKYMHPVEKECYGLLKTWAKDKPDSNFKELLNEHREPELKKLQAKQNTILDSVDELSQSLTKREQEVVKKVTDTTRKLVCNGDKDVKFKRKTFIKDVEDLAGKISNTEVFDKMVKEANKMPNSQNDVSSFVVKYSAREHQEIGNRLVKLSVGTIEHIHPRSEGGRNNVGNYMLECAGCNHERSSIPLGDWVDSHPEMVKNTQKYIDEVIRRINTGEVKGFSFYPEAVARTLYHESDGKLNLDTSAVKKNTDE